jgi:hypothetical protein
MYDSFSLIIDIPRWLSEPSVTLSGMIVTVLSHSVCTVMSDSQHWKYGAGLKGTMSTLTIEGMYEAGA